MPVSNIEPYFSVASHGGNTYPFAFKVFDQSELVVKVDGTVKTLGLDYTVTITAEPGEGGSIIFQPGYIPAAGSLTVEGERAVTVDRSTDYQEAGGFRQSVVDKDFDRLVMMTQDRKRNSGVLQGLIDSAFDMIAQLAAAGSALLENFSLTFKPFDIITKGPWLDARAFPTLAEADAFAAATVRRLVISTAWDIVPESLSAPSIEMLPGGKLAGLGATTITGRFVGSGGCIGADRSLVLADVVDASWFEGGIDHALTSSAPVIIGVGTYPPLTVAASNKTIIMSPGVKFKVPDGEVISTDISGPAALEISGNNVSVFGDFECDGNSANQNIAAFTSANRDGILRISGDNVKIHGTATLTNPYFVGLQLDGGNDAGGEMKGFYADRIKVVNSYQRAAMIYSADGWEIGTLEIVSGANSYDPRVRFGTGDAPTSVCKNGKIGLIDTDWVIIFEQKSYDIHIETVRAVGGKIEGIGSLTDYDAGGITIDNIQISGKSTLIGGEYYGWGLNGCYGVHIRKLSVKDYESTTAYNPFFVNKVKDCRIDDLSIKGTKTNTPDVRITGFNGLTIGSISSIDPVGTGNGVWLDYDASFAPQTSLTIGNIRSAGHATYDFIMDSGFSSANQIRIGALNSDAKRSGTMQSANSYPGVHARGVFSVDSSTGVVTSTGAHNIASVTESTAGVYVVNFTAGLPNVTTMIPVLTALDNAAVLFARVYSFATTTMQVRFYNDTGALVRPDGFYLEINGY